MIYWVLLVIVYAEGVEREWTHRYSRREACEEVRAVITYRREQSLEARCEQRREQSSERGPSE